LYLSAQPFVGGDIVVYQIGNGSGALSNAGNPILLQEYSPTGVLVSSTTLPTTNATGTPNPIINSGSGQENGELSLSADGRYLTFTGYEASLPNITGLKSGGFHRDVGRIDVNGNLDTSTVPADYGLTGGNATPAAAISVDGSSFYLTAQFGGLRYINLGSTGSSTLINTVDNTTALNQLQIYNGQLYVSDHNSIYTVGTGEPTTGGAGLTPLTGVTLHTGGTSAGADFFFATLDVADHGTQPDTLYVADAPTNGGQIDKYTATFTGSVPTSWTLTGSVSAQNVTGLTGYANGSTVVMYATAGSANAAGGGTNGGGGALYTYTDTSGFNTPIPGGATAIKLAALTAFGEGFRGVAFVPNQAPTLIGGNSNLPSIVENPVNNSGQLVSAVLSGLGASPIGDTAGSHQGIAVTSADQSNGTWQFNLNDGQGWQSFGAVSDTTALTLAADGPNAALVRFVPNANYSGSATFTFRAWDQSQGINGKKFDITHVVAPIGTSAFSTATATATQAVTFVNQAPSFVRGPSQSVLNTAGAQSIPSWATNISKGAPSEAGQVLNFIVSNDNNALFSVQPSIDPTTGTLTYTPAPGANGTANVTVQLHDNGGTGNGGHDTSAAQNFQISATPVGGNRPPVNLIPFAAQTTLENQPITFSNGNGNAISVSDPDAGSSSIQVTIAVTGGNVTLNNNLNGLSGSGNGTNSMSYTGTIPNLNAALAGLVFMPTTNLSGVSAGAISLMTNDLGNTGTGGAKTSTDTITINITPVNQAPSFTAGGDVTVPASGSYSQTWATNILPGPANESGQSVNFIVSNNNNSLFLVQPSISPTGILTFTPVAGLGGTATVSVQLQDNGGTANGGVDKTNLQTFLIQLTAVDLPPVISAPGTQRLIQNTPLVFSSAQSNAIAVSDPDGFSTTEKVTLTAAHGIVTLAAGSGVVITQGANASATVTFTGNLNQLSTALNGLTFTPDAPFTGNSASVAVTINDQSATSPGPLSATATININVVAAPPLVISEVLANPPGLDEPNQYIEIRSAAPNYTIPNGTYFISVSGSPQTLTVGNTLTTYPTGTVYDTFDLSGRKTGSDGYLVILENGNTYNNFADAGGLGLIDPRATVLDNGVNPDGSIAIGTGAGFGNNFVAPGSSIVGHSALFRVHDTDLLKPSATYMLIQSPGAVTPGDQLDAPANVPPTGTLHGAEFNSWTVFDSVGAALSSTSTPGDLAYGYVNFIDTTGSTNHATPNSTAIGAPFSTDYFARANNDSGSIASDWVGTSGINGQVPTWGTGSSSNTLPASYANRPLNNIGGPNFDTSQPAVVTTSPGAVNYPVGSGPVVIDSNVTVTDPDSFFLGSAQVAITSGWDPVNDTLSFTNTPFITGSYDHQTGILTLKGDDTFDNWNAALQSVTFTYANSVVGNPPSRTITFKANDGAVLSNAATRTINIQGPVVSPPVVTGTSGTPVAWIEALPPASAPTVVIAPALSIADASTTQLTSATVSIAANFASGEDLLGWNTAIAAANHITVTASPHSHFITLAPSAPDTSESLAAFQAVLRTVTYSDSSGNPSTVPRTVAFTVVDSNSITSSTTTNSQQVVDLTAVNNPPVVTTVPGTGSYVSGSAAILVDGALTETDPDTAILVGATARVTGPSGLFVSGDTLAFVNQAGVTGAYNASTGVLTLSGNATPLDYQIALRAITFSTSAGAGLRTISFQADDGATPGTPDGNVATKQINVAAPAGVPGDYNGDGIVNAADYTVWRDHLGQTFQLQNEGPGVTPGHVTSEDYSYWTAHFGASSPGSGSSAGSGAVSALSERSTLADVSSVPQSAVSVTNVSGNRSSEPTLPAQSLLSGPVATGIQSIEEPGVFVSSSMNSQSPELAVTSKSDNLSQFGSGGPVGESLARSTQLITGPAAHDSSVLTDALDQALALRDWQLSVPMELETPGVMRSSNSPSIQEREVALLALLDGGFEESMSVGVES
jgi:hypothetical protein